MKVTIIRTTQTAKGFEITVDGAEYKTVATLTEVGRAIDDRPWPTNLEAGDVEFTKHYISCDADVVESAKVIFKNAAVSAA